MATPTVQYTYHSPVFRYRQTSVTADEDTASTHPTADAPIVKLADPVALKAEGGFGVPLAGRRGCRIIPFGTDAADEQFDLNFVLIYKAEDYRSAAAAHAFDFGLASQYIERLFFSVDNITLSALKGNLGGLVSSNDFFADDADAITVTTYGSTLCTAFGAPQPQVYDPDGSASAALEIFVPDCGNAWAIRIYFDGGIGGAGAASANCLLMLES